MSAPTDPRPVDGVAQPQRPEEPGGVPASAAVREALIRRAVDEWRAGLIALAGGAAGTDIGALGDAIVDLTSAHPSGIAQLFAGRPTRLSNLFREGGSLPVARRHTRAVVAATAEQLERDGAASIYLALGVATWSEPETQGDAAHSATPSARPDARSSGGSMPRPATGVLPALRSTAPGSRPRREPVLLRPITITPHGGTDTDYDLTLEPTAEVNPVLVRSLRDHGAEIDPDELTRAAFTQSGFDPTPALVRVIGIGASVLADFELDSRVLVGPFLQPSQGLVDDLEDLSEVIGRHEVIAALAGSVRDIAAARVRLPPPRIGDPDPAQERGVGDLDPSQRHVIDVLATGCHLYVDAPAGVDVAGTIAAVAAEATASGRAVLYVSGHRRAAETFIAKMTDLGLGDLLLDAAPAPGWRQTLANRLLSAMALEHEDIDKDAVARLRDALLGARSQLSGYIEALHLVREPWGVSAYDALQALARLTADRPGPSTQVRLSKETVLALPSARRRLLGGDLARAADLGAFTRRSADTPWAEANITSAADAQEALLRIRRLRDLTLPKLREEVAAVAETTGLTPAATLRRWGEQLTMLSGMSGTLDVFQPRVFERSVQDMVEATATKQWRAAHHVDLSRGARRRLGKQARDMLRPGVRPADLHAALIKVEEQRLVWREESRRGGWPVLPEGLAVIEETYEAVRIDLEELEPFLPDAIRADGIAGVELDTVAQRLDALAEAADDVEGLPARTNLTRELRAAGLGDLVADLARREVDAELVGAELDLAWWSSVFEQILAVEPVLADQDSAGLGALAQRFRSLDREHIATLAAPVRVAVRECLATVMRTHGVEAEALFTELLEGRLSSVRELGVKFPDVVRRVRPVAVVGPTLLPRLLPPVRDVDVVIIDAVEQTPLEVLLPAIARGRQILVIGDRRAAAGSAIPALARVLPSVALVAPGSRRDPYLTEFLDVHGYDGVLRPMPFPRAEPLVAFDLVDGQGMPDPVSGSVESTQVEVDRVVEVAIEHAMSRPDESFAIVTVTRSHVDHIRDALATEVRRNPALATAFSSGRAEPVVTTELEAVAGLSRDTIIFSAGFGRTPHGRVLHRFGPLNDPGGDALLLAALAAARRRLHVVSSFRAEDLDPERLRGKGAKLLARLLRLAEQRDGAADQVTLGNGIDVGGTPDRLVLDLAERLWRAGLVVETNYGIGDGQRIPLVIGHPEVPGELLVAVLTDDAAYVAEPSIRVRDRQVAERLERLGWVVVQVWSAAVFLDPAKEADRLQRVVQQVREARGPAIGSGPAVSAPRIVPVVEEDVAEDDDAGDDGARDADAGDVATMAAGAAGAAEDAPDAGDGASAGADGADADGASAGADVEDDFDDARIGVLRVVEDDPEDEAESRDEP